MRHKVKTFVKIEKKGSRYTIRLVEKFRLY